MIFFGRDREYYTFCATRFVLHKPLLFFLKCLDDDKEIFELIKREIKARDRFILCDSQNSRESEWVQKEIEFIKSLNRPYEIIDLDGTEDEINERIKRFNQRSTVYIWSTEALLCQMVAQELMKKAFRVSLLPMNFYQHYTPKRQITDGYVLMLISRKLTDQETDAVSISAKVACGYTYPVVISKEGFANWELYRELQNLDGLLTRCYLLDYEKRANDAVEVFQSDKERVRALVDHFVRLDNYVNNKEG
jgi:hypothetical protein